MTDETPILDEQVLTELRQSVAGDEAFLADLVAAYLVEGASYVEQITAAASTGDVGAIVRPAHSLKSSSAALGATRISQLSRSIESAGREGRGEGLAEAANEARTTWDATVAELKERGLTK